MKKFLFLLAIIFGVSVQMAQAQIVIDNSFTAEDLVNDFLLGEGVNATNITFNGMPGNTVSVQHGLLSGTSNILSFDSAIVMGTADVEEFATGMINASGDFVNDPDLVEIAGQDINNAAIIEFDFVASSDSVKFNYVFASTEYPGFTCSNYNDAFGFFLSGPGIAGRFTNSAINIALIPGTDTPVAINTVNSGMASGGNASPCEQANPNWIEDSQYFFDNTAQPAGDIQFPGMTVTLSALADVECGGEYHIKLAIGNASDQGLQSGVFLEAGSFAAFGEVFVNLSPTIVGATVVNPDYADVLVAGCSSTRVELVRPGGLTVQDITVTIGGSAIEGTGPGGDYIFTEDPIFNFPEGVDTIVFAIETVWDMIPDENEEIIISITYLDGCNDTITSSASLQFVDPYTLLSATDDVVVSCPADSTVIMAEGVDGIEPYIYDWGNLGMGGGVLAPVPADSAYYVVEVTDICDFEIKLDSVLVVNNIPEPLTASINPFVQPECANQPVDLAATVENGNGPPYFFTWSDDVNTAYPGNDAVVVQNINPVIDFHRESLGVYMTVFDSCGTTLSDSVMINYPFFDPLTATFPQLTDNCPDQPVELRSFIQGGAGDEEILWGLEGGASFAMGSNGSTPSTFVVPAGGVNNFGLYVTDKCRRAGWDSFSITEGSSELDLAGDAFYEDSLNVILLDRIMNVITPNGDNRNDFFIIDGVEAFDDARLEVYDRWGKLIFETDDYDAGKPTPKPDNAFDADGFEDGTYFYIINVDSGECVESGYLEVLGSNN